VNTETPTREKARFLEQLWKAQALGKMVEGKSIVMLQEPDEGPVVFWNIFERRDYLMAPKVCRASVSFYPRRWIFSDDGEYRRRWFSSWMLMVEQTIFHLDSTVGHTRWPELHLLELGT
jgi:hypothetical protein